MEEVILGGGYTCSVCGQYHRTSALCNHNNPIINNMEKSRTPLEILIEDLKKSYNDNSSNPFFTAYSIAIMQAEKLLETEKERIITDYNSGYNNGNLDTSLTGEEYYDKYYKK